MQPVARGISDGEVFRSSPQYSFAFISINNIRFQLGDNVLAETEHGERQLCKIISIFLLSTSSEKDDDSVAIHVLLYQPLAHVDCPDQIDDACLRLAKQQCVQNELVLVLAEVLLKGEALKFIKQTIRVVEQLCQKPRDDVFLCRHALEDGVSK